MTMVHSVVVVCFLLQGILAVRQQQAPAAAGGSALEPKADAAAVTPVQDIPAIDCNYGNWGPWSPCSATCGIGSKFRVREILAYPTETGKKCAATKEVANCESGIPCVRACEYSFGPFSPCSKPCGGGIQKAKVVVEHHGRGCPEEPLVRECNREPCQAPCETDWKPMVEGWQCTCDDNMREYYRIGPLCKPEFKKMPCAPVDDCDKPTCELEGWTQYGACSAKCGPGVAYRTRTFKSDGVCVPPPTDSLIQEQACDNKCKLDCEMGPWDEALWKCSAECGTGTKSRRAKIIKEATNGGSCDCVGEGFTMEDGYCVEKHFCNEDKCPVDCEVGDWGAWTPCTKNCMKRGEKEAGNRNRRRTVLRQPERGGQACPALQEVEACGKEKCPEDCKLGQFTPWSVCSAECGGGQRDRRRYIEVPPQRGGKPCASTVEFEACNTQLCPVECVISEWSEWSKCSRKCQSAEGVIGTRMRRRSVKPDRDNSALACPGAVEYETCKPEYCPEDCVVGDWKPWSSCTAKCDGGFKFRERDVDEPPRNGGKSCPHLNEKARCNTEPCSRDCVVSAWGMWTNCSKPCSGGDRERFRTILVTPRGPDAKSCPSLKQEGKCNKQPCPQNCEMSEWSDWSACSKACGPGTRFRTRGIVTYPMAGGIPCPGTRQQQKCETAACDEKACKHTGWGPWSKCSQPCLGIDGEVGTMTRKRTVITEDGVTSDCKSSLEQTRFCNEYKCPVDGEVSQWTSWTPCTSECGGGEQTRTRTIDQVPRHNGKSVPHLSEKRLCNESPCPKDCVISEWGSWEACSLPCKNGDAPAGTTKRERTVLLKPDEGGKPCPELKQVKECNQEYCPVDCTVSSWAPATPCTSKCGYGYTFQERNALVEPKYGGKLCPILKERHICNLGTCKNCSMTPWSRWSECSAPCGGGYQVRHRTVLRMTKECSALHEEQPCNEHACPSDCVMSKWGPWSQCNDDGIKSRTRYVISPAIGRGKPCPMCLEERDDCIPPFKPEECWLQPCSEQETKELQEKTN